VSWLYKTFVRPVLFTQNPESIHNFTIHALGFASRHAMLRGATGAIFGSPQLPVDLFGLHFPNPIGLAAGLDKAGEAVPIWHALGLGFSELGAVTWHAQPGNPSPRVFRAVSAEGIVNRMGFNNGGARAMAEELARWRQCDEWPAHPVGINLGKSKTTPLDQAAADYAQSFETLRHNADFFVVNVSSPNTPNLRQLQDRSALDGIFAALQEVNGNNAGPHRPILVKLAPDLTFEAIDEILQLAGPRNIAGIIATNTTITRPETADPILQRVYAETGGLSGRPLRARSTEVIRHIYKQTGGSLPIIGVGGIFTADDAWEKITAGASLLQVYTGMIFEGPGIARALVRGLQHRLHREGFKCVKDAVGSAVK